MIPLPLVGQSYHLRSPMAAAQTCMNLYPEIIQDPNENAAVAAGRAQNKAFLYGIPGRHVFKDLTTIDAAATPVRGVCMAPGFALFVVAGTKFMGIDHSTGALIYGPYTVANPTWYGLANSPATFSFNGTQVFVVAGGVGYVYDIVASTFTTVTIGNWNGTVNVTGSPAKTVDWVSGDQFPTDGSWVGKTIVINGSNYTIGNSPAAPTATRLYTTGTVSVTSPPSYTYSVAGYTPSFVTGTYLNDSFFANQSDSRAVNFSNVFNGTVWNGLDAISKDTWPDFTMAAISNGSQLFVFGTNSFDVFQANPGSTTTFFTRINGASANIGTISPWSPISIDGNVYFMGTNAGGGIVAYVLNGFTPVRISQHGQEAPWTAAGLGSGAISYTYTEEGHSFWVTNFGSQTWAYDTTTGAWHQRGSGSGFTQYHTAYHASGSPAYSSSFKHFTAGPLDGTIYTTSVAFYDDNGSDIYWQRCIAYSYNGRNRIYDSRLELEMETGTSPAGTPLISLDWTDDGGHTFSTPALTASAGAPGAYSQRVYWEPLGSFTLRAYRFSGNGQGRVALIDCEVERELGTN